MAQSPVVRHLDLDAVLPPVAFSITLNGAKHELKEADVEAYLANIRDVQNLALAADIAEETEFSIKLVKRAFPTIQEAELRGLRLSQLQAIIDFARGANGEEVPADKVETAEASDDANPPNAGN